MKPRIEPFRPFVEILAIVALAQAALEPALPVVAPQARGLAAALLHAVLLALVAGPAVFWRCLAAARRTLDAVAPHPPAAARGAQLRQAVALTAAAQAVGLAVTVAGVWWLRADVEHDAHEAFEQRVERLHLDVQRRLRRTVTGLGGVRALVLAAPTLDRATFRAYVEARDLARDFPGVRGFGLIERVPREALADFVARQRADAAPDFEARGVDHPGDAYVIRFIEPLARNAPAWGYDIAGEALRRAAAERAVDSGETTLTPRITLLQDGRRGPGFLLMMPVYRGAPATPAARREALVGLVYAPLVAAELFDGLEAEAAGQVTLRLADAADAATPVFALGAAPAGDHATSRTLDVGGRRFLLEARSTPAFDAGIDRSRLTGAAIGGALLSFALALTVWLLASARVRAHSLAERMTLDLERAAAQARADRLRLVQILDGAAAGTWEWHRASGEFRCDARFAAILGDTAAGFSALGARARGARIHPQDLRRLRDALDRHLAGAADHFECEARMRHRDGHWVWLLARGRLLAQRGASEWLVGTAIDVTARKDAEDALRASRAFLDRAGRLAGVGGWEIDLASGALTSSEQAGCLFDLPLGHRPSVAEGLSFFAPADRRRVRRKAVACLRSGKGWNLELPATTRSGRTIRVRWVGAVERENGRAVRLVGALQDVTAQHLLEEELRRGNQLLHNVLENLPCGLSVFDREHRLIAHNRRLREMLGLPDALLAVPAPTFESLARYCARRGDYGPGDVEEIVRARVAMLVEGEHQFERPGRDGAVLDGRGGAMPDGGVITTYTDISERKRHEVALTVATRRAEEASRAKSRFLANTSHELRTPMNAVLGMLQLLKKTPLSPRQLDCTSKAEGAARALLALLDDILDFSKVEAGKMRLDPRPFAPDRVLRDLSVILAAAAASRPVEVVYDIDPAVPARLRGDDLRLAQVLVNLGGNAIKFTPEGEVVIEVRVLARDAGAVRLGFAVADTGIGIAPEHQRRIFGGFSQAEASTTRRFGGTGLGLAISQRLVALMGGELTLVSTPGRGSRFAFALTLPVEPVEPAPPPEPASVLVVDAHERSRAALAAQARTLGWRCDVAADAEAARRHAASARYDAWFVDARLPGAGALQAARGDAAWIVTGAHDAEGADAVLAKPATASMLADALRQARAPIGRRPDGPAAPRLAGLRLLVVEDNANNRQVAQELLEAEGARVDLAVHGAEGVAAVARATLPYDAVLMDVQMPVMDGYTATAQIRRDLGLTELPIIAMTANVLAGDREACLAAGMNDHVGKPFDLDRLVETLCRHAGRAPAARREAETTVPAPLAALAEANEIDLGRALARLGGRRDAYARLLRSFLGDAAALQARIAAHLAGGDRAAARRELHTLKGLAATLGAGALADQAAHAERSVEAEGDALLPALDAALDRAGAALAALADAIDAARPAAAHGDPDALRGELDALAALLADADLAALDAWARLRDAHARALAPHLDALDAAIAALDFRQALALCRQLAEPRA